MAAAPSWEKLPFKVTPRNQRAARYVVVQWRQGATKTRRVWSKHRTLKAARKSCASQKQHWDKINRMEAKNRAARVGSGWWWTDKNKRVPTVHKIAIFDVCTGKKV